MPEEISGFRDSPDRKIPDTKTSIDMLEKENEQEYLRKVDKSLEKIRRNKRRHGFAFVIKYVGAWYIVLSIFQGLFYKFSWTFDLIGLGFFIFGHMLDSHFSKVEKEEFRDLDSEGITTHV